MKRAIAGLIGLLLLGCAKPTSPFVQGPIRIALPVRESGVLTVRSFLQLSTTRVLNPDKSVYRLHDLPAPLARGFAKGLAKAAVEVALVGEAGLGGNLRDGQIGFPEES